MNETEDQAIRRQLRELEEQALERLRFYHPGIPGGAGGFIVVSV